ncbi:transport and Golgi organization 2 homolog isoform X2 [Carica papaya]|uniref:transport and Golgi organization 2 homolog isoform X2 n=1 Tax=Carica papaya TaxID=3649 RepID=UPI000B8D0874|nr:transport and Golgi organization 2 homolog isoform X2 [Carica papaya]
MCIAVFLWQSHRIYPFILLLNRDEYLSRPTKPLAWWEDGEIVGGRDTVAGGTWLACTKHGRLAFLTNFRELRCIPDAKSRGDLPVRFLHSKKNPKEFAENIVKEADQYNGFNLILADLCSKTMVYITNRPKENGKVMTEVSPGIHVLSNSNLDAPWPKAERLRHNFKEVLDKYGESELPIKVMVEKLMRDTTKDEESELPHIYPPVLEYHLSSIFVDVNRPLGRYSTRSTSALYMKWSGETWFYEKYVEKDLWKEQTLTYQIKEME